MKLKDYFGPNCEFSEHEDLITDVQALLAAQELSGAEIDTLEFCYRVGMMESGDTPSKGGRAMLLNKGILCQTCWKNNDYTFSVTYPYGYKVYQALSVTIEK